MANQKLTDRIETETSEDNDLIHIVKGGVSFKIKKSNFVAVDAVPTDGSDKPVSSNGTFDALATKNPLISHLEFNDTDKTVWNNGKGDVPNNTSFGSNALISNTTGFQNTAIGNGALFSNTIANQNTAIGSSALQSNTTGFSNTANGHSALISNTTGATNTANGVGALLSNTTGDNNSAIGQRSLRLNTTGDNNSAIGQDALQSNTTGSNNTAVGRRADVSVGNLQNATAIGANAVVDASNKIQLGNENVTEVATSGKVTASPATLSTHLATKGQLDDGLALKTNIADIVNNVTAGGVDVPLSAEQGKILKAEILALAGSLIPQGNWNANTNSPDISATTETGYYWIVSVDGATDIGGITDWKVTDWAIKTATGWAKIDNTDKVLSVNDRIGEVELDSSDVGLANVNNTSDANKPISSATQTALNLKANIASPTFTGNATFGSNVTATNFIGSGSQLTASESSYGMLRVSNSTANAESTMSFGNTSDANEDRWTIGKNIAAGSGDFGFYRNGGQKVKFSATGDVTASAFKVSALNTAPASASSTGVTGDIRYTADYIYVCVATDTWKRSEITTW